MSEPANLGDQAWHIVVAVVGGALSLLSAIAIGAISWGVRNTIGDAHRQLDELKESAKADRETTAALAKIVTALEVKLATAVADSRASIERVTALSHEFVEVRGDLSAVREQLAGMSAKLDILVKRRDSDAPGRG